MTIHHWTLDADGDPVPCEDLFAWADWMDDLEHVCVARTLIDVGTEGAYLVTTLFLGLSVCGADGSPPDWEVATFHAHAHRSPRMYRVASREEARVLHRAEVERLCVERAGVAREVSLAEQFEFLRQRRATGKGA